MIQNKIMVRKYLNENNRKPLITIITVVLNGSKTIEKAIKSIVNQTYRNFEYIIIDGCSTDGTLSIIKKYNKKIDYWISEPDKGLFDAMNKGIKLANGEYIYFLLADDYIINSKVIEKVANDLIKYNPSVAYGQIVYPIEGYGYLIWPKKEVSVKDIKIGQTLPQQGLFFKRKLMLKAKLFDLKYDVCGDRDILCKCVKISGTPFFLGYLIAFFGAQGKSSGLHLNEAAEVVYRNFGLLNMIIFYLTYGPLIFVRYFLNKIGLFRYHTIKFLAIFYKYFFKHFFPFYLVQNKKYSYNNLRAI